MVRANGTNPFPAKPLDDAIAEYLMACEVEGKSPRTVQAYDETLRMLRRIVGTAGLPTTIEGFAATDVYQFLKAISDSPISLGTRHRRFRKDPGLFLLVHPHGLHDPLSLRWHRQREGRTEGNPTVHRGGDPAVTGSLRSRHGVRLSQSRDHLALPRYRDAGAGVAPTVPGSYPNLAIVDPTNAIPEVDETNNQSDLVTPVAVEGANQFNDLSITKADAPDPVSTAGVITYTIMVTNDGTDPAFDVALRDFLPAGSVFISAEDTTSGGTDPDAFLCTHAGGVVDCTGATVDGTLDLVASVPAVREVIIEVFAPVTPGVYTNQALVDPDDTIPEGNETNNQASTTTSVEVGNANEYIDLEIGKDATANTTPGGNILYTLTVTNTGTKPRL